MDVVKKLGEKGVTKLSQKVGEKAGRKLSDSVFNKKKPEQSKATQISETERSERRLPEQSFETINNFYQSPENSGDEIFKILSSASKPNLGKAKQSLMNQKQKQKQSEARSKAPLAQQEINERLNMLMNM